MKKLRLEWCRSVERFFLTPHRPRSEEINGRWSLNGDYMYWNKGRYKLICLIYRYFHIKELIIGVQAYKEIKMKKKYQNLLMW